MLIKLQKEKKFKLQSQSVSLSEGSAGVCLFVLL